MKKGPTLRHLGAVTIGSLAVLFLLDGAVFRSGLYSQMVAPESYAGSFQAAVRIAAATPSGPPKPVLLLGDSRITEGFSPRLADRQAAGRVRFVNAAIPGSSVRAWFYLLRALDPRRDRYPVIVIPVDDYDDEDGAWDHDDEPTDQHIVQPALRFSDIPEFVFSFRKWDARWGALRESLVEGLAYRDDLRDFLRHPQARLAAVRDFREHVTDRSYGYEGSPRVISPGDPALEALIHRPPSPQTGHYRQFRSYWLGRLLEPYTSGGTRFLIVRVPRNPWPIAHYARFDPHSSIRSLASRRHVVVADETLFQSLEKPAYFFDAFHLNRAGREAFTAGLAEFILRHFC